MKTGQDGKKKEEKRVPDEHFGVKFKQGLQWWWWWRDNIVLCG